MQVNKITNTRKATFWVVMIEALLWMLLTGFILLIHAYFPDDFYLRYPKVVWFNLVFIPFYLLLFRQRAQLRKLVSKIPARLLSSFVQFEPTNRFWRKWILFRISMFFIFIALAQPLLGTKMGSSLEKNSEVVIAMDISNSMNTLDIDPNLTRLEVAKRAAIELINGLEGEKVGVLIFAGNAYVQLPITQDYNTAKLFIKEIETNMLSNQGTNFDIAIDMSRDMFSEGTAGKCILMVTDGENHEKVPEKKLKKLPEENIFLAVVGLGTSNGGLIYRDPTKPFMGYITDEKGRPVLSKVGKELVESLAKNANGIAMVTDDPFPNLSNLLTEINQLNKGDLRNLDLEIKETYFHIPLIIGLVFWLLFQFSDFLFNTKVKND